MRLFLILLGISCMPSMALSQETNYDESKVPDFELPAVLTTQDQQPVKDVSTWESVRRPEILTIFENQMFGTVPDTKVKVRFDVIKNIENAIEGVADLKEVDMNFSSKRGRHSARMLLLLPANSSGPVPVFLGLNFYGNHTIHPSEHISITESWARNNEAFMVENNQLDERSRGIRASRWPVEYILGQGYGLAVIYYGDLDPDYDDGFQNGLHPLFYQKGQTKPAEEEWGSIGIWAWGFSRALDYLKSDQNVDGENVIVFGHSRLGKTSLWAGAQDERFAGVISNNSGCGGAALSKRKFGETVGVINNAFPHWFNDYFNRFNNNEEELAFDQHMLISLMAPRPVYIASAVEDRWADPYGEYLSGLYAGPVYELYDKNTYTSEKSPDLNQSRMTEGVSYHIRNGKHDVTLYDWEQYILWADKYVATKADR